MIQVTSYNSQAQQIFIIFSANMVEDLNKIHNSIIETSHNMDNEQPIPQKAHFERLNLTEEQLFSRIKSLKDFQTYQRTKIQRINLKNTQKLKKSPLLEVVDLLGKKRKENKVLVDYVNSQIEETRSTNNKMMHLRYKSRKSEQKKQMVTPIFINFKLKQRQQLSKVAKMLKQTTQQSFVPLIQRCHSQSKTIYVNNDENWQTPIPKELLKLKRSLKMHPMFKLKRRLTIDASRHGYDLDRSENKQSNSIQKANERENINEKEYSLDLKKMESSLDLFSIRHSSFQQNSIVKHQSSNIDILMPADKKTYQSLTTKDKLQIIINSIIKQDDKSSNKLIGRWPCYSQFDLTEDQAKVQKIILKFKRQTEKNVDLEESHYRLHQKIEDQFRMQQQVLDWNALGERNPLGAKFSHYLRLEKDALKKNIKQLEDYRKFVKIEKQKHQVWANGIKRLKKY